MMVIVVLVLLQQLCLPVLLAEARQLHSTGSDGSAPTVTIPQGTFIGARVASSGTKLTAIEQFLGVPYAQPPTGAHRYSPALAVGTSNATFNATVYGLICIQAIPGEPGQGEDCLTLNIFRPLGTTECEKLPVVVYIHGGSFIAGSGGSARDVGRMVAASPVPILGVSINYRLGALGFLSSGVLARAGALNLGLRDAQLALKWMQANLDAFGGDPTKVTIMGDSAGGHAVGHFLQNTASAGLFHQVIMESGAATARFCQPYASSPNPQQVELFMSIVGINSSQSDDVVLAALRALPFETIVNAGVDVWGTYMNSDRWAFQPVIDGPGGFIPSAPLDLWTSGEWNKIPILTGFCNDEGAPFVPPAINTSQEFTNFFTTLNPAWNPNVIQTINELYPDPLTNASSPYADEYARITAAYGQFGYIAPVRDTAHFAAPTGIPVYFYNFKVNSSVIQGTGHACSGVYVEYEEAVVNVSSTQQRLAKAVNAFWASFIAYGDPNVAASSDVATWPRYAEEVKTPNKIVFGAGNDERAGGTHVGILTQPVVDTEFLKQTQFWWNLTIESEM